LFLCFLSVILRPVSVDGKAMSFKKDNPYGILIVAIPFVVGGILMLLQNKPGIFVAYPGRYAPGFAVETASVDMMHAGGIFGLGMGGLIVWFYFKVRGG
jgi:hypothetical protein